LLRLLKSSFVQYPAYHSMILLIVFISGVKGF